MKQFGRLLSAMVFQNIAAIMVVGMIRAMFGVYGWWPNDRFILLINPMLNELIPILIGYTGGRLLGGQRGAVVAAVVTLSMALASSVPMVIGAMFIGTFTGWLVGRIDTYLENRLPVGFELLVANFISALLAFGLSLLCFTYVGQAVSAAIIRLNAVMQMIINSNWLLFAAAIIEPAKVFFFNNMMNHGILGPLGIQQVKDMGKSVFFLLETNPGPGLGVLLAYFLKTRGKQRSILSATMVIHSLGGIQEVYFPYVLMRPILLLSVTVGGMTGIALFQYWDAGLVATPSPPSLLLLVALAPRDDIPYILISVLLSSLVSFASAFLMLRRTSESPLQGIVKMQELKELEGLQYVQKWTESAGGESVHSSSARHAVAARPPNEEISPAPETAALVASRRRPIRKIVFACDAGMGSSAMGAAMLKKKLRAARLEIEVANSAVDDIPVDADLVVTQKNLTQRAKESAPDCEHVSIDSYVDAVYYDQIIDRLKAGQTGSIRPAIDDRQILLGCEADSKQAAIEGLGRRMIELGYVRESYIAEMLEREKLISTNLGNGVAIPHGLDTRSGSIVKPGIVIAQFPQGVRFDEEVVYLLIGVAGRSERQAYLLSSIAEVIDDPQLIGRLIRLQEKSEFIRVFQGIHEMICSE